MNRRVAIWTIGAVALAGLTGAGYRWWRTAGRDATVAASIPRRPDLGRLPGEMAQRVEACERRARSGPDRVDALGELSRLYHANGFFAEASLCYQGLLQVDLSDPYWWHRLATILAGYGQLDDALPLWRQAVKLAPEYVPVRLRLGDALLKTNRSVEAAQVYAEVLKRDPQNPYALLGLARIDIDTGRWDAAREKLEAAVAQSDYGIGYDLLPTVYEHLGEPGRGEAIRARYKASGAYYDVPDPWLDDLVNDCYDTYRISAAAGTADHVGNTHAAVRILGRAIAIDPAKAVFQYQMAGFYLRLHDNENARRYFERCTVLAPDFADGWAQLADLLKGMGEQEASGLALDSGLANCPSSPGLHLAQGQRLSAAGRFSEAVREFKETIRLRPQEADGYVELADCYFRLNRIEEGVAELRKSLKVEPENPTALSTLAFIAIRTGDRSGAKEWLRHVQQQPRIPAENRGALEKAFQDQFGQPPD